MYHIFDVGGLLLKRFHGCEAKAIDDGDKQIASWQAALSDFLDKHLLPLLKAGTPPCQIIAAWDRGNTCRRSLWADYKKARREKEKSAIQEKETKELFKQAETLFAYLGCKQVWVPGEEADDVIALLCQRLDGPKLIYTVDEDLLALVDAQTSVARGYQLHSLSIQGASGASLPYALTSLRKAIVGDSSDGYGGVPRYGIGTFDKLYAAWGESGLLWLQGVIDNNTPQELQPYLADPLVKKLYDAWPDLLRGWSLARLHPEACYGSYRAANGSTQPKRPEWKVRVPNAERVQGILKAMLTQTTAEFQREEALAGLMSTLVPYLPTHTLITADNAQQLLDAMPAILASEVVAYDFESSDKLQWEPFRKASDKNYVDVLSQEVAGISVNYGDNHQHTVYVSFDHANTANLGKEWATWLLQAIDSREDRCVVQNAGFELVVAARDLGYMPRAPYDTAILASYVDENEEAHLKGMSQRVLNYRQASYAETTFGKMMCELPADQVLNYACDDSLVTALLFDLYKITAKLEGYWDFYQTYEVDPAVDDAWNMIGGVELDVARLEQLSQESALREKNAISAIHAALSEHCSAPNEAEVTAAAQTLLQERWLTEQFKVTEEAARTEKYAKLWQEAWQGCLYSAPQTEKQTKVFVPTPTMVAQVIKYLDSGAPTAANLGPKQLRTWADQVEDFAHSSAARSDLLELVNLLLAADKYLAAGKRQGPAYERLAAFCQDILDQHAPGKVTTSGTALNFGSNPQMQNFLYGLLRLPIRRRSKPTQGSVRETNKLPGSPATGLKAIAAALVYDVLPGDWRQAVLENYAVVAREQQLASLYFGKLSLWVHPADGKIHPSIRNCGTMTRRPAGNSPNMLQVKKGDIRTMFPAPEGYLTVSIDFSNQEVVLTACAAQDPVMLDAFSQTPRLNIHTLTASGIAHKLLPRLGVPCSGPLSYEEFLAGQHSQDEQIKKAYSTVRNKYAKQLLFGIVYGSSAVGVAETLLIPLPEAEALVEALFNLYQRIPAWQREVALFAREHGYVEMPFGSRRHAIADLWSDDRRLSGRQDRQLSNSVIQSGAAEVLKVVRQHMFDSNMRERYALRQVLPIYDEISSCVPESLVEDYIMELSDIMRVTPPGYPVGMEVEVSVGRTWGSQLEIGLPTRELIRETLAKL